MNLSNGNLSFIRAVKEEKARRILQEMYRRDPMLWLKDRLGEDRKNFLWGEYGTEYEHHVWDGDKNPMFNAWRALSDSYIEAKDGKIPSCRTVAVEAATGTSKTWSLARIVYWFLDCFPNSLVVTTAPTEPQLKLGVWSEISKIMRKIRKHHPKSNLYTMRLLMDDKTRQKQSTNLQAEDEDLFDGWLATSFIAGTNKDEDSATKARGLHREFMLILLEEASGMDKSVVNAFKNTATGSFNYIFAVGNPNSKSDSLHTLASDPSTKNFRVSAYDYPNVVLQKEVIAGAVTQASIQDRALTYGKGSRLYDAMVRGICPDQASNALIHREWLLKAVGLEVAVDESENAAGVDVAASENGDKAAIAYGNRNTLTYLKEFTCPNATYLSYNILFDDTTAQTRGYDNYEIPCMAEMNVYTSDYVGVDAVGVGVATIEGFTNLNYPVLALSGGQWEEVIPEDEFSKKPMWSFNNLRSQMYYELREDLRQGRISISITDKLLLEQLFGELTAVNFDSKNGKITIEPKEAIKKRLGGKSPNVADAVVYWNWARKGYRVAKGFLPISAGV